MDTTPVMLGAAPASTSAPQRGREADRERERRYFDDDEHVVDAG